MREEVDPVPRAQACVYHPYEWPIGQKQPLIPRNGPLMVDLGELLEKRQTRRSFETPLDDTVLAEFLWLACRNRSLRVSPYGVNQESRVHPSAGAMHPIHVLLARDGGPWMLYDPVGHVLTELPNSTNSVAIVRAAANRLLSLGKGVIIGLIAEPGKTAAKYHNHETLVWRDSGIVHGYMSVVAEALGLAFCPLGITGYPHLTDYLPNASLLQAVGLAVLGAE